MRQQSIHLLLSVAVLVLWWHTEAALLALQQPPTIAAGTAEFLRYRMPALPFLVLNQNFAGFLQCQRVVKPQMWVGVVMCPTAIFLFWLAIRQLQLGTNGAALALTCVHSKTSPAPPSSGRARNRLSLSRFHPIATPGLRIPVRVCAITRDDAGCVTHCAPC